MLDSVYFCNELLLVTFIAWGRTVVVSLFTVLALKNSSKYVMVKRKALVKVLLPP